MEIIGKIIETRIREVDFSEVQLSKPMAKDEMINELKERYKFEGDKSELNRQISAIENKVL